MCRKNIWLHNNKDIFLVAVHATYLQAMGEMEEMWEQKLEELMALESIYGSDFRCALSTQGSQQYFGSSKVTAQYCWCICSVMYERLLVSCSVDYETVVWPSRSLCWKWKLVSIRWFRNSILRMILTSLYYYTFKKLDINTGQPCIAPDM